MSAVRFDGQVAIVTGAAPGGLGEQFARLLAARGACVVVNDVLTAETVAEEIRATGGEAIADSHSVAVESDAAEIVQAALDAYGRLDIVVNNAGVLIVKPFPELTTGDLRAHLSVHVEGAWNISHAAWPIFQAQHHGKILMVASANGIVVATPAHSAYAAAKGAMGGLTRALALEGADEGIKVNALLPGADTKMSRLVPSSSKPAIMLSAGLVAPGACWLVHQDCDTTGRMFVCSSARIAEVFTAVGSGFQSTVAEWSLESIQEHWSIACNREDFIVPDNLDAYSEHRTRLFAEAEKRVVVPES